MRTKWLSGKSGGWLALVVFFISFNVQSQFGKGKPPKPHGACEGNCFSIQVISAQITGDCCTEYVLRVSHDGTCRYDLSHFTVALPCGTVSDLSNSRNWAQKIGKDPTTGLNGFKIDDIPGFGKDSSNSFTVNVKVCGDSSCLEKINVVAYKAGQCVDYDTLNYEVTGSCGGGGNDTTKTCSTLSASMKAFGATCFGASNGRAEVTVEDGKEPFSYQWSTGSTDSALYNIPAGIYSVTITDSDGNILTLSDEVTQPQDLVVSESLFNPSCMGSSNGSIDITVTGGEAPYTYSWSTGATTQDIGNLNAGTFKVVVTDALGCGKQLSYLLLNNVRITASGVITKASCGQANGGVDVSVTGGSTPYTYSWDNGAATEDLTNVSAGTYRLTVIDANGCRGSGMFVVGENNTLKVNFETTPAGCANESIGAIDITAVGGTAPYTYKWQHGPTTEDLTNLIAGIYRVTVTDNTGCTNLTAINVPKKSIQVNAQITQPRCNGDSTGSIVVVPIDGSTTYTYNWSTGDSTNTVVNVPAGSYTVTITDASGCSRTLSYTVTQPDVLEGTAVVSNSQCGAEGSFAIDLIVTGGKTPYSYLWSTGAVTQDLQGLNSGTYSVQITDVNGCTTSREVVVTPAENSFSCTINPAMNSLVCGSAGNALTAVTTDAQSYQWSVTSSDTSWTITNGATTSAIVFTVGSPGSTATFSLTIVKDGCTKTCTYAVETGCIVRDSNGGGDPSTGDPCSPDTTTTTTVVTTPPAPDPSTTESGPEFRISAYPNPFVRDLTFEWTADKDDVVRIEISDYCGKKIGVVYAGSVQKGETYSVDWSGDALRDRLYFYKYTSSSNTFQGKLFRK